ncbi:hypothetical protein QR680_016337 [Steinernema hermaphroditum]|uniref:TOG domain-containing protein n=1 Tax=Steinernema hermaphroditum TaxID=289476 RepID=A0AA39HAX1_9BILA|nr:hypothetical protein QR680_016337 [Steinernema hermaphroditum]
MDPWDLHDSVDVLAKLPPNFYEQLESKKWQERKESLQSFIDIAAANPRFCPKANYGEIVAVLRRVVEKDANINCAAAGAKCICALANGLRKKFQPHAAVVVPAIFEKFKEKKPVLRDPLIECIDAVSNTISLDIICDDIVAAMGKPNPNIKLQTDMFLYRTLKTFSAATVPKKVVKAVAPLLVKHTGESDPDVREASYAALGAVMKALGEKAAMMFPGDIAEDKLKMGKIQEFRDKAAAEAAAEEAAKAAEAAPAQSSAPEASTSNEQEEVPAAQSETKEPEIDPWDLHDPVDVLAKLPPNFYEQLESKKWQERKESLQSFIDIAAANPRFCPQANYGEIVAVLRRVVEKDANINCAAAGAKCICALANGLRKKFQPHAAVVVPAILEKFKEKKPVLRDPLIECIDAVSSTISLDNICDDIVAAMGKPNPNIKLQTDMFLSRTLKTFSAATVPKKVVKAVAPLLVKHTGESDPDVREASYAALGAIMKALGEKAAMMFLSDIAEDKLKMGKIQEFRDKALAECPNPVAEVPKPPAKEAPKAQPKEAAKAPAKKPAQAKAEAKAEKVEEEAAVAKPPPPPPKEMLFNSLTNGKASRLRDERSLKLLKWNFDSPTSEHIDQLKSLFGDICKPPTVQLLFHKDFKMHLKIIEQMQQFIKEEPAAILGNSDLILKWMTLRFFDTNPAVLLRSLDFTIVVLSTTLENQESFTDQELTAFLPYLLLKSGEPKDAVRGPVREIVQLLAEITSPAKVYPLVLDALKTKNSRQKAECLGFLEGFIDVAGMAVAANCQGSLKVIASCIADRDSSVRNGALNAIVAAYKDLGDRVFQAIGKISDKDRAMLDERIKRCGVSKMNESRGVSAGGGAKIVSKNSRRSAVVPRSGTASRTASPAPERERQPENDADVDEGTLNFSRHLRGVGASRANVSKPVVSDAGGRFRLDPTLFKDSDDEDETSVSRACIIKDTSSMNFDRIEPQVRLRQNDSIRVPRSGSTASITSIDTLEQIDRVIVNMGSLTISLASEAIAQMQSLTEDCPIELIADRIDQIGNAVVTQLSLLRSQRLDDRSLHMETEQVLRLLCNFTTTLVKHEEIIQRMSSDVITMFLKEMLQVLCDRRVSQLEHGKWVIRSLNVVLMKLCEFTDPSSFIVGAVKLICMFLDSEYSEGKLMDFLHKCLYKQTERLVKPECAELDLDHVILSVHEFMERFPDDSNPAIKSSRKAVEVVIQRVVVATRHRIRAHIGHLPEKYKVIVSYINRCLRGIEKSSGFEMGAVPGQVPASAPGTVTKRNPAVQGSDAKLNQLWADISDTLLDGGFEDIYLYIDQNAQLSDEFTRMIAGHNYEKLINVLFPLFTQHLSSQEPRPLKDMNFVIDVLGPWAVEKIREQQRKRAYVKSLFPDVNSQLPGARSLSGAPPSRSSTVPCAFSTPSSAVAQKPKLKSSEMASYRLRLEELRKRREDSPGPLNRTFTKDE